LGDLPPVHELRSPGGLAFRTEDRIGAEVHRAAEDRSAAWAPRALPAPHGQEVAHLLLDGGAPAGDLVDRLGEDVADRLVEAGETLGGGASHAWLTTETR